MTKAHVFAGWRGRDDVVDLHVAVRNNDPVNEQLDELSTLGTRRVRSSSLHPLAELLHGGHDVRDSLVLVHLRLQLLPLPLYCRAVVVQPLATPAGLREAHRSRLVGIAPPLNPAPR